MEKSLYYFNLGQHHLNVAKHMFEVVFEVIKDERMLIKVVRELAKSVNFLMKSTLAHEAYFRRVNISRNAKENYKVFIEKLARRYFEKGDIKGILNVLRIEKMHNEAALDFVKGNKFVILLNEKYEILDEKLVGGLFRNVEGCFGAFGKVLRKL